jgi:hypothetical protein
MTLKVFVLPGDGCVVPVYVLTDNDQAILSPSQDSLRHCDALTAQVGERLEIFQAISNSPR